MFLIAALMASCGPREKSLGAGYVLVDADGDDRTIKFRRDDGELVTVIPKRVNAYATRGDAIIVQRQPPIATIAAGGRQYAVRQLCEHWIIDTKTHTAHRTTDPSEYNIVACDDR